jgi:hypothetical protein
MQAKGHTMAVAVADTDDLSAAAPLLDLSSGYIQRAAALLPKQGARAPWRVRQSYVLDLAEFKRRDLFEAIRFSSPDKRARRQRAEVAQEIDDLERLVQA